MDFFDWSFTCFFNIDCIALNCKVHINLYFSRVVKTPNSYYVFTTIDGINMPRFAPICHFRYIFHNLHEKSKPRKSRQNTANQRILGGIFIMIKILFVCHGSTSDSWELAALVGQNGANRGISESGLLRFYYE